MQIFFLKKKASVPPKRQKGNLELGPGNLKETWKIVSSALLNALRVADYWYRDHFHPVQTLEKGSELWEPTERFCASRFFQSTSSHQQRSSACNGKSTRCPIHRLWNCLYYTTETCSWSWTAFCDRWNLNAITTFAEGWCLIFFCTPNAQEKKANLLGGIAGVTQPLTFPINLLNLAWLPRSCIRDYLHHPPWPITA